MTILALAKFSGEIPKLPSHLLPPGNAQEAIDCDFSHGELRGLKVPFVLQTVANVVKGLYTPDGLRYFTWTVDADAVKAPTIDDAHDRIYYTTPTDFRVTKSAFAATNGGEPSSSYRVGVPQPTFAPAVSVAGNALSGVTSMSIDFWYEYGGQKYQEQTNVTFLAPVDNAPIGAGKTWLYTPPAKIAAVAAVTQTNAALTWSGSQDNGHQISTPTTTVVTPAVAGTPDLATPMVSIKFLDAAGVAITTATPSGSSIATSGEYNTSIAITQGSAVLRVTVAASTSHIETRAYVFTLVNNYDEEGAPSPSSMLDVAYKQPVTIGVSLPAVDQYVPFKAIRVYRSNTSSTGAADYQFVADFPLNGGLDMVLSSQLNEPLHSYEWLPPSPSLQGLCSIGNGVMAAFKGNEVQFCEAYRGSAWPPSYTLPLPYNIVSIIPYGSGLLATTTAYPYLISGVTPDSMSQMRIPAIQAGVSKRSIADTGHGIVYASNDGLVMVNGANAGLENSQAFFTREDWRARYGTRLSALKLACHDGALIGFFEDADGFVIRLDEVAGTLTKYTGRHSAAFILPQIDQVYMASGTTISQFAGGAIGAMTWKSGEYVAAKPLNFGAGHFDGSGSFTLTVYCDGVLKHTRTLTDIGQFRLPSGFLARKWSFKLVGTGTVRALHIAESMMELANV